MDDKVNDFLNEINEIAPAPPQRPPPPKPEDQGIQIFVAVKIIRYVLGSFLFHIVLSYFYF